ncbi:MAG: TRAP transporter substrate-binding protein [Candidatus Eremiobacteraeota bacterium]|nr:TRAP transporter substrate-binding protein [Candidatus Eremiobacteraeota bacterium]
MDRRQFIAATGAASVFATIRIAKPALAAGRTLRFGHWVSTDSPHHQLAQHFADEVAKRTNGALTISIFPAEVLGTYAAQLEQNVAGTLDFSLPTTTALAKVNPHASVVSLPYLFHSAQSVYSAMDGSIGKQIADGCKGVKVLAFSDNGFRNITNSKHAIEKPADLAGMKLRIPPSDVSKAIFTSLGASPMAMPYGQVLSALKAGIVDGQENPFVNIYTGKFYEAQKYLAVTRHQYEGVALVAADKTWSSLDPKLQAAVQESATSARDFHRKAFEDYDKSLAAKLKASGMAFTEPDAAAFKAKVQPVYAEFTSVYGGELIAAVKKAAG